MKSSRKNQAKGKLKSLKGKTREIAGVITGRRKLEAKGMNQKLAGKALEKLGQVQRVLGK